MSLQSAGDMEKAAPVSNEECRRLADFVKVIAQPQRLSILFLLREKRRIVADIERMTGITQPMLSQHLGQLRRAELVVSDRVGRQTFYTIAQTKEGHRALAMLDILVPEEPEHSSLPTRVALSEEWETSGHGATFARIL